MKSHNEIIDDRKLALGAVIYGSYVKLDLLEKLVYETYGNSSISQAVNLNIFVDINSIIHSLYSENNRITYNNITDLSSGIVNMCAHYRHFFKSRLGVYTRFFLVNSLNTCELNKKFLIGYNSTFENKANITQTKNMIDNNLTLLKLLCQYLPNIYYIDSVDNYEASVIMAYIIEKINDHNPNLILSRDLYPLQLTALYPYTSYLYPLKSSYGDNSWMLPINEKQGFRHQFWYSYIRTLTRNTKNFPKIDFNRISPLNFALYCALTTFPTRDVSRLYAAPKAIKFIETLVGSEDIKIDSNMFLTNPDIANNYPVAQIDARYKVMDVEFALQYYKNTPDAKEMKFIDLEDNATVNMISAKYYENNPLMLQYL